MEVRLQLSFLMLVLAVVDVTLEDFDDFQDEV